MKITKGKSKLTQAAKQKSAPPVKKTPKRKKYERTGDYANICDRLSDLDEVVLKDLVKDGNAFVVGKRLRGTLSMQAKAKSISYLTVAKPESEDMYVIRIKK